MSKEQADAIFEHHRAIANTRRGTRLITKGNVKAGPSEGGTIIVPDGEHLAVSLACDLWLYVNWAKGAGVVALYVSGEEFHKLEIVGEAKPQPAAAKIALPNAQAPSPFSRMQTVASDPMMP